ncbi:MAG: ribose-phosphate diphosphokinase [Bacteroidota bacterium]
MNGLKVFSGRANTELSKKIAKAIRQELGQVEIRNFSDGEIWAKYGENIRGRDVFIIQPTSPPAENLLELLILIDAAKRASASRVTAVIPYFGYARQDRKDQPRVSITAKLVANLLTTAGADRIITMDLHAAQIQGFFDIPLDHLYSAPIIVKYFKRQRIPNLTVVAPDVGGARMARAYAKRLGADLILIDKRRPGPNLAEIMNVVGNAKDRNILIVDDLIDTARTFANAVEALKNAGALDIYGACTHAILSDNAVERIENSAVKKLIVTDSVAQGQTSEKIVVLSVAELFAEAILRTHKNQSISSLFDIDKN